MTDPVYEESDEEIANLDSEEEESGEDKSDDGFLCSDPSGNVQGCSFYTPTLVDNERHTIGSYAFINRDLYMKAQEEALGKLNFMKHGRYEIDEGILAGYTQRNLLDKIGTVFMENVQRFEERDVDNMCETLQPLVKAREGLQVQSASRSAKRSGHGGEHSMKGQDKTPQRTKV